MVTLSTSPLIAVITASEVVPGTAEGGGTSIGQGQFPGKDLGWGTAFCRAGIPYRKGLGGGPARVLGKDQLFPFRRPQAKRL